MRDWWRGGVDSGRRTAIACVTCTVVAGVVVLLESLLTELAGPPAPAVWWTAYAAFLGLLLVVTGLVPHPRRVPHRVLLVLLVLLVVAAIAAFLAYSDQGWTALVLVVAAAVTARWSTPVAFVLVVVVQTAAVGVGAWLAGWPLSDMVIGAVAYAGFQVFAGLTVLAARRETEARHELAEAHDELRAAMVLLEEASRDSERLRIARDLHDVVGHQLTGLALELEVASHTASPDPHVLRARDIAKDLLADVRGTVSDIRRVAPRRPLEAALRSLAQNTPGLTVTVSVRGGNLIPTEQADILLRCAQESITNTLRHGRATRIDLAVDVTDTEVCLSATDDGRGTDQVRPGNGLVGMTERLESAGGGLTTASAPGQGFRVVGVLPRSAPPTTEAVRR